MKVMGFRAEKDAVHWAVLTGTVQAPVVLAHAKFEPVPAPSESIWLAELRNGLLNLLEIHAPQRIGLHLITAHAERPSTAKAFGNLLRRARAEGIVMEIAQTVVGKMLVLPDGQYVVNRPSRDCFLTSTGERIQWNSLPSWSCRQSIMAAAALLKSDDASIAEIL